MLIEKNKPRYEYAATGGTGRKLTDKNVIDARRQMKSLRCSLTMLCRMYKVNRVSMSNAIRGKTFGHLPGACRVTRHIYVVPENVIRDIREDIDAGMTHREASRKYGYSSSTISKIINRKGKYEHI